MALDSLLELFPPEQKSILSPPPQQPLPPRPEYVPQHNEKVVNKGVSIHYPQYMLPVMLYPGHSKSIQATTLFMRKLKRMRTLTETQSYLQSLLYHAYKEEKFLADLLPGKPFYISEAGVREIKAMGRDVANLIEYYQLKEDIQVEQRLRDWVKDHSSPKFSSYGVRLPRRRRAELKAWETEVKRRIRLQRKEADENKFMAWWRKEWNIDAQSTKYRLRNQRKLKRNAKKARRKKLGKFVI